MKFAPLLALLALLFAQASPLELTGWAERAFLRARERGAHARWPARDTGLRAASPPRLAQLPAAVAGGASWGREVSSSGGVVSAV